MHTHNTHMYARTYTHMHTHTHTHTHIHTYIHAYIHTYTHIYMRTHIQYIHIHTHTCTHAYTNINIHLKGLSIVTSFQIYVYECCDVCYWTIWANSILHMVKILQGILSRFSWLFTQPEIFSCESWHC